MNATNAPQQTIDDPDVDAIERLVARFDPTVFDVGRRRVRIRIEAGATRDVVIENGTARLTSSRGSADAVLTADAATWSEIADDVRGGMAAFRKGRLKIRRDLHLGVGFLAATADSDRSRSPAHPPRRHRRRRHVHDRGRHRRPRDHAPRPRRDQGLVPPNDRGAHARPTVRSPSTYPASATPTSRSWAAYDAPFFARAIVALLDALELERAHVVGNSMGGRVALELGLDHADRVGRLALLAPSLPWLKARPWAPYLRLVPTQLGVLQPAPRAIVERIVKQFVPGSDTEWTAAGIDEFMRSYLTRSGRAAFYAAARNIYLEEPRGRTGLWTRLPDLTATRRCSSGGARTTSCRSGSSATSAKRSPARSISSSTAAMCPSSSGLARPTTR